MSKPELRAALRTARKSFVQSLTPGQRHQLESRLSDHLRPMVDESAGVGGYHAVGSEIDVGPVLALARSHALPTFDEDEEIFRFRSGPASAAGPHGIPQPPHDSPILECALVLVPLIGIDPQGHRLGQGGGHYDRALPALREAGATLIGVGWDLQRLDFALPHEQWDVALDGFCCPGRLEMFR